MLFMKLKYYMKQPKEQSKYQKLHTYEPATPQEITNGCDHLNSEEKQELFVLLDKLKDLLMEP